MSLGGLIPLDMSLKRFSRRNFWNSTFSRFSRAVAAFMTSSWNWMIERISS